MRLTVQEQANVRAALFYLHARVGAWVTLAKALHSKRVTLRRIRAGGRVRVSMARRVARLADVPVGDVLTGKYPAAGTCLHCGHGPARSVVSASGLDTTDDNH